MFGNQWTVEDTAILRRRWDEGASASVIGKELGVSRSAVLGRVFRLGLAKRREAYAPKKKLVPSLRKSPTKRPQLRIVLADFDFIGPVRPADWCPNPVGMVDLTRDQCRWPVGEPNQLQFCGESKLDGRVYCARHCRMAYQPKRRAA